MVRSILTFFLLLTITSKAANPLADVLAKADPSGDAKWDTEQFSELAGSALKNGIIAYLSAPDTGITENLISESFKATELRPPLKQVFKDDSFEILRPSAELTDTFTHQSEAGFRAAFEPLKLNGDHFHGKAKIVRVETPEEDSKKWSTLVFIETSSGPVQQNAEWLCTWLASAVANTPPLLDSIKLTRFEEIHAAKKSGFSDCTEAVLGGNASWKGQLIYSASHWHANLDVAFGINQGNQGVSIADANGDGLEDIFVCQPDGLPNRFFLQQPDGTLLDHSRESNLDILDITPSALMVDLDNDNDVDLILSHRFTISIFENDGAAHFTKRHSIATESRVTGISAADYDHDADLDIHICGYSPISQTSSQDIFANPVPYEDAENGAFNYLFRNDGNFTFTDATAETGMDVKNTRFSFTAAWEDYDNDGDQDLYIANDFGRNNLFRNDLIPGGKAVFKDVAVELGVEDIAASMSVDWADADNDGRMDLYVSNMWSSAGNRIAFQKQFKTTGNDEKIRQIQRHARGNSYFKNQADGKFQDVSEAAGVTMGRWAWGSLFADLNNDGWEDIYVANGFMTAPDTGDL
jgi:hypothetical protein